MSRSPVARPSEIVVLAVAASCPSAVAEVLASSAQAGPSGTLPFTGSSLFGVGLGAVLLALGLVFLGMSASGRVSRWLSLGIAVMIVVGVAAALPASASALSSSATATCPADPLSSGVDPGATAIPSGPTNQTIGASVARAERQTAVPPAVVPEFPVPVVAVVFAAGIVVVAHRRRWIPA